MTEFLISQVKRKLNITWEDEETTARVDDIVNSAIPNLIHKLGIPDKQFDFSEPGAENVLFLNYCLYDWNHALNEFDDNYANEISQIRDKYAVAYYLQHEGEEDV